MRPWADVEAANWHNAQRAVLLTDLSRCTPASALALTMERGCWRLADYQADALEGTMLLACPDTAAAPVDLALEVSGTYAIFVGVYSTRTCPSQIWLQLDTDVAPVSRASTPDQGMWSIEEVFFKVAELCSSSLRFIQQTAGRTSACGLAYVKLIPLTAAESAGYVQDRDTPPARPLTATCDGFSFLCVRAPRTAAEVLRELEPLRHTDFRTLLLHLVHGDTVRYPSAYHQTCFTAAQCHPAPIYAHAGASLTELERQGTNYAQVLIEGAHDMGIAVHVGLRPGGWTYYQPYADMMRSAFYDANPEWRTVDRDGTPVARMSWAVPQVRARMLGALADSLSLGADGAHIVFNRGLPVVLFEPPFCQLFEQRHGLDPRHLDEADPRIIALRCELVTQFMVELREHLDQEQGRRGGGTRLASSVCVLGTEADNLSYGIDIRAWAAAGLIDEVHIYRYNFGATRAVCDLDFLLQACRPWGVHVSPMFSPNVDADTCVREALEYCDAGAHGLGVWDAFTDDVAQATRWGRLGRSEELRARAAAGAAARTYVPLRRLDGEVLDGRFPIYWGG
jgi:hypothetical protein